MEEAIKLDADSVTIYQMEAPFYDHRCGRGGGDSPVAAGQQRVGGPCIPSIEAAGYVVSRIHASEPTHAGLSIAIALARRILSEPVWPLWTFPGVHYERGLMGRYTCWMPVSCRSTAFPAITDHQWLIREMILQLKTGMLDAGYPAKFNVEIATGSAGFESLRLRFCQL